MHPLSFGSVKEQTLDFRLSPIPRHRRLTADFRTRRFPDLVVHEFDRSPWRWRTVWRWRTIWRWGAIFGLTNRVAAVLVRVRVVGFFAHHRDALMVLGAPTAALGFFILLMARPCAVAQGGDAYDRDSRDGDAEREHDYQCCAREDDLVN